MLSILIALIAAPVIGEQLQISLVLFHDCVAEMT